MSPIAGAARRAFIRNSRPVILRLRRTFLIPSRPLKAEIVQDMYLRELRTYKPTPIKSTDSEGHVQKFTAPKPPKSPADGNIAQDLKAYEQQQVEVEGQVSGEGVQHGEDDWFEEPEEEENAPSGH